jgi:hypothetical protein
VTARLHDRLAELLPAAVVAVLAERTARIRRQGRDARCSCASPAEPTRAGRCSRCFRRLPAGDASARTLHARDEAGAPSPEATRLKFSDGQTGGREG